MPKVSVIIPVYKVEEYLPQCLDSVEKQTYADFELILVDDGSPDTCGALCDAYAATHPNTRVIHQENMGLSEARNQGVKVATGEYVTFIDSDDYVSEQYVACLVNLVEKHKTPVAVAGSVVFQDGACPTTGVKEPVETVMPTVVMLEKICYNTIPICAWGKIYKRELAEKYPYPKGQLYEDTSTTHKILGETESVAYTNQIVYYWRQRSGSITHDVVTEKHYVGITASKELMDYMAQHYPQNVPAAAARCVMKMVDLSYRLVMGKNNPELFKRIRRELKPFIGPLLRNRKAGMSIKVRAFALWCGYVPHLLISKLYYMVKKEI